MTMTQQAPLDIRVDRLSSRGARDAALRGVVEASGFSLGQLRAQAAEDEFPTLHARLAWLAIEALED